MSDNCKHCGACRTCDFCACCGKCRACGSQRPLGHVQFVPVPQWSVYPEIPQIVPSPFRWPYTTAGLTVQS